ncbi:MAG: TetR/AcrR family transcriptional regulator [Oceanicaulis sp.]
MEQDLSKRRALVIRLTDHVLQHGLTGAGLRPMARAAGTSDRMLIYYFKTKDSLMAALLEEVGARIQRHLETDRPAGKVGRDQLLDEIWAQSQREPIARYLLLMVDLAIQARGSQGPYAAGAQRMAEHFCDWIATRLDIEDEAERSRTAFDLMATLDGLLLLKTFGLERPPG